MHMPPAQNPEALTGGAEAAQTHIRRAQPQVQAQGLALGCLRRELGAVTVKNGAQLLLQHRQGGLAVDGAQGVDASRPVHGDAGVHRRGAEQGQKAAAKAEKPPGA